MNLESTTDKCEKSKFIANVFSPRIPVAMTIASFYCAAELFVTPYHKSHSLFSQSELEWLEIILFFDLDLIFSNQIQTFDEIYKI